LYIDQQWGGGGAHDWGLSGLRNLRLCMDNRHLNTTTMTTLFIIYVATMCNMLWIIIIIIVTLFFPEHPQTRKCDIYIFKVDLLYPPSKVPFENYYHHCGTIGLLLCTPPSLRIIVLLLIEDEDGLFLVCITSVYYYYYYYYSYYYYSYNTFYNIPVSKRERMKLLIVLDEERGVRNWT